MIPQTPRGEGDDQLDLKRDEKVTIEADIVRLKRLLNLAQDHYKSKRAKELKDEIGTQEKYLEDLAYDIKELEVSFDGEPQTEEEEAPNFDDDESGGSSEAEPGPDDTGASDEDSGELGGS